MKGAYKLRLGEGASARPRSRQTLVCRIPAGQAPDLRFWAISPPTTRQKSSCDVMSTGEVFREREPAAHVPPWVPSRLITRQCHTGLFPRPGPRLRPAVSSRGWGPGSAPSAALRRSGSRYGSGSARGVPGPHVFQLAPPRALSLGSVVAAPVRASFVGTERPRGRVVPRLTQSPATPLRECRTRAPFRVIARYRP